MEFTSKQTKINQKTKNLLFKKYGLDKVILNNVYAFISYYVFEEGLIEIKKFKLLN